MLLEKTLKKTLLITLIITVYFTFALDTIKLVSTKHKTDERHDYPHRVLIKALEQTINTDGPYKIEYGLAMNRERALKELIKGKLINVHEAPTRKEWEESVIPIRIPLRKGLIGYRIFLINNENQDLFKKIKSPSELKKLKAGLGTHWSTTKTMKSLGFNIVTTIDYENLFLMLAKKRFDYFPRGLNEVFHEFQARNSAYKNMCIEESKMIYFPTPVYLFISPKEPKLADRIKRGMIIISKNGMLDELFQSEYSEAIKKANVSKRTIFRFENPFLSEETPLDQPHLWYKP